MGRHRQICERTRGCIRASSCSQGPTVLKLWWRDHEPLQKAVKDIVYVHTPFILVAYHALCSMGYDHYIQNGSHDCRGPAKLRVRGQNSPVGSASPRVNRARDKATQRVANN
jgi:hypothetical protein